VGLYVVPGERVEAGAPVAGVADLSTLRCVLDVFEQDIGRVRPGQSVEVTVVSAPGLVLPGRVTYISPRVDEETHAIKVRADVENLGGRLKFGMFVTARILVEARRGLAVPKVGVQTEGNRAFVFAVSGPGRFERRWVTLGAESGPWVEVRSGVAAGERVVGLGSFALKSELLKATLVEEE